MDTGQWGVLLYVASLPIAAFCELVRAKVACRREGREFTTFDFMPWFFFWPFLLAYWIIRRPLLCAVDVSVNVTDSLASKIAGDDEKGDTLLRPAESNPLKGRLS